MVTALMWASANSPAGVRAALLAYGVLALWSPFGMIGLLPLVVFVLWSRRHTVLVGASLYQALAALAFALVVATYLAHEPPAIGMGGASIAGNLAGFAGYLPFLVVELAPFALLLRRTLWQEPALLVCLVTLTALPVFEGSVGDFVMRASMGPLAILSVRAATQLLVDLHSRRIRYAALALFLSVPTVASEVAYHLNGGATQRKVATDDTAYERWLTVFAEGERIGLTHFFDTCGWRYVAQYFSATPAWVLRGPDTTHPE
jgi:hypothetical protein